MTAQEAKNAAIADGYQGEPTPEVLRLYGWQPRDPLKDVVITGPARSDAQLSDDLALLHEEMVQNQIPTQIINSVLKFGKAALAF